MKEKGFECFTLLIYILLHFVQFCSFVHWVLALIENENLFRGALMCIDDLTQLNYLIIQDNFNFVAHFLKVIWNLIFVFEPETIKKQ